MCPLWSVDLLPAVSPFHWENTKHQSCFIFPRSIPVISEDEAREALAQFASEKCYYGKGVPKDMVITEIKSTSAYHVSVG